MAVTFIGESLAHTPVVLFPASLSCCVLAFILIRSEMGRKMEVLSSVPGEITQVLWEKISTEWEKNREWFYKFD